ncbi:LruC domain-containing protein [Bacteroides intestinalis]|uniref:LruC domain-containing protein n=1 Tax=Bacteroides intestinalis TaxID=329854 RepID=UPI001D06F9A5|nr:LruC domain-containing protein [Bacteroides intestinalis]MCG4717292.1 LruC domain-containing protein [Bacteroides intestinalis]
MMCITPTRYALYPPVENPLGEDFVAPTGFDWSMITTVKLNIEVKDEFNGMYNYLAEVFTTNPLTDATATPIAADYAKAGKNYVVEISIPKSIERVYVRQTDPKQRKEVYEFVVPGNGETLNCKLYYSGGTTTRAGTGSTSAANAAIAAGFKELEDNNYTVETPDIPTAPDKSDDPVSQYDKNKFNDGARIVVPAGEVSSVIYQMASGKGTIFVKGTWKVTNIYSNFDIYVLNGGKIEIATPSNKTFTTVSKFVVEKGGTVECTSNFAANYGDWFIGGDFIANGDVTFGASTSSVTIASGVTMSINNGTLKPCSKVYKNFGTITAATITANMGSYPEIYNAGAIEVTGVMDLVKMNFINKGELTVGQWFKVDNSKVLNKGQLSSLNLEFTTSTFSNYGAILVDEQTGVIKTNNTSNGSFIVNHDKGIIKGYHLSGGVSVYNDSYGEFTIFENSSVDILYNSCALIVKEKFNWGNVTLDNGSITGEKPENLNTSGSNADQWKPVPVVMSNDSPIQYILKNGSVIKATLLHINRTPSNFRGEGSNPSLLQVGGVRISQGGDTNLKDLVIEMPENAFTYDPPYNGINNAKWLTSGCSTTGWGGSKNTFSTCGGYYYSGNEGDPDPEDPEKPDVEDKTVYTYAFEDQWPAYGDFDMNDIVVSIDKMTATNDNKKLSIKGHIRAVGSSRKTGVGIQFLNVSSSGVTLAGKVQNGTPVFESGQNNPVVIISINAHKHCNPNIADDDFSFYNTIPSAGSQYNGNGAEFEIIMTFPTAEEATKAMNVKNLDVFIISKEAQGNIGRTEVHMANYAPTNLGTTALFGMSNDASANNTMLNVSKKGYYISTEGLAWGICIPNTEVWKWPKEYMMITGVYPDFKNWVINGGQTEDLDWISNHTNDIFVNP